jgi:alpha-tubulin suppressor-like RCC1 family protein
MAMGAATAAVLSVACSGDAGVSAPASVVSVEVSPSSVSVGVFATTVLSATPRDSKGNALVGSAVKWASANSSLATVSDSGLVTTLAPGVVTITATIDGKVGTASITVEPFITLKSLTSGGEHNCGLTGSGAAYCWGANSSGELGDGTSGLPKPAPTPVGGGLTFTSLTAGWGHTCGLIGTGMAYCWGDNRYGQLGDASTVPRFSPVAVSGGIVFAKLASGQNHTCGLTSSGAAFCWGDNEVGALGDGTRTNRSTPVAVMGGLALGEITAGGFHTCGLTAAGLGYCWGNNSGDPIGGPETITGGLTFSRLTAGGNHTCGLTMAGVAYCWGYNFNGQLGNGGTSSGGLAPEAVADTRVYSTLTAGSYHTCGSITGGAAYCWGGNSSGGLGDGTTTMQFSPVAVAGGLSFSGLSIGSYHTCGLSAGGAVYCWGWNGRGQLGDGTTTDRPLPNRVRNP